MGSEDLQDELFSINAIYGDSTFHHMPEGHGGPFSLKITVPDPGPARSDPTCLDTHSYPHVIWLKLLIPPSYPSVPPTIESILSLGDSSALRGQGAEIIDAATSIVKRTFQPGQPIIADLIEGMEPVITTLLQSRGLNSSSNDSTSSIANSGRNTPSSLDLERLDRDRTAIEHGLGRPAPDWIVSDTLVEKKSVFIARLVRVQTVELARQALEHLLLTDKKTGKATHNISAWRIRAPRVGGPGGGHRSAGVAFQDCDDDGETAAGGRLLHLLQLMDVWGVLIVVSRWYGGVHLGPARFKLINSVARQVLVKAGLA